MGLNTTVECICGERGDNPSCPIHGIKSTRPPDTQRERELWDDATPNKSITERFAERMGMDGTQIEKATLVSNSVVHPTHYNTGKIEVWDAIIDWDLDFLCGTAVKHIARAGKKDIAPEREDLEKAINYLKKKLETIGE